MKQDLNRLKKALHPEKQINIVEQCRIVHDALSVGGEYQGQKEALATFLEISPNKVYKMKRAHEDSLPELKKFFETTEYQVNTYYDRATLSEESQRVFLHNMHVLTTDAYSLSQTIIKEDK